MDDQQLCPASRCLIVEMLIDNDYRCSTSIIIMLLSILSLSSLDSSCLGICEVFRPGCSPRLCIAARFDTRPTNIHRPHETNLPSSHCGLQYAALDDLPKASTLADNVRTIVPNPCPRRAMLVSQGLNVETSRDGPSTLEDV